MKIFNKFLIVLVVFGIVINSFVIDDSETEQIRNDKKQENQVFGNNRNLQQNRLPPPPPPKNPPPPAPAPTTSTQTTTKFDTLLSLKNLIRSIDGTNNGGSFSYGQAPSLQSRICAVNYKPGSVNTMRDDLPNPRQISNLVGNLAGSITSSKANWNMLFPIWGQFIDHDIGLTQSATSQSVPIKIPKCDAWMDTACTDTQTIPFKRSAFTLNSNGVRTQTNQITAWVDGSQVYGSDTLTASKLRTFVGGKLKTSDGNLLPKQNGFYFAGDVRVNQNIGLTALHTVFLREHNRLCDIIIARNSSLSDEQIYNAAKNYVTALIQHFTYDEFLPSLMGKTQFDLIVGPYISTNDDPSISTEFQTAGYRLGHPMINAPFNLMSNEGSLISTLSLGQMFFNPNLVTSTSFSQILNGLIRTNSKQRSLEIVNDLRNFLTTPDNGNIKLDLFALNIQRARDHGICSVQQARQTRGLNTQATFGDIFAGPANADKLRNAYGSLDKVDLWLGIIGEKSIPGSDLGQIGNRIVGQQFKRIRNGDKNWYQNIMGPTLLNQIKSTSLGTVIKRNSQVTSVNTRTFVKL